MFIRVVTLVTLVTLKIAPGGGRETPATKSTSKRRRTCKVHRSSAPHHSNPPSLPSPRNVTDVTLPMGQESLMFMRVVTLVTLVTLKIAPGGGEENGQHSPFSRSR